MLDSETLDAASDLFLKETPKSEAFEKQQKKAVLYAVSGKEEKALLSTLKVVTNYDIEVRQVPLVPHGNHVFKPVPKKYMPRIRAPSVFHQFQRLPIELRFKVWGFAVPAGRTVQFDVEGGNRDIFRPIKTSIPAVLHACHESRKIALKILVPLFRTITMADRYIYMDVRSDTLKLSLGACHKLCLTKDHLADSDRNRIKHLEIPAHIDPKDAAMANAIACLIMRAPNRSWPAMKTLFLSGREGKPNAHTIKVRVTRPANAAAGEKLIRKHTKAIKKKLKNVMEKYGTDRELAIRIEYE